jgi:hypothetical protein
MKPFRLAFRKNKQDNTIVRVKALGPEVFIGEGYCTIIAGPAL